MLSELRIDFVMFFLMFSFRRLANFDLPLCSTQNYTSKIPLRISRTGLIS